MYPCDRDVLDNVLSCIQGNDCLRATNIWSAYKHSANDKCSQCLYMNERGQEDCSMCLEAKLRMLSLYEGSGDTFGELLLSSARKLEEFHVNPT